jgi:hypothetical protein
MHAESSKSVIPGQVAERLTDWSSSVKSPKAGDLS